MLKLCGHVYYAGDDSQIVLSGKAVCNKPKGHDGDHRFIGYLKNSDGKKFRGRLDWHNFRDGCFNTETEKEDDCHVKLIAGGRNIHCSKWKGHKDLHYAMYMDHYATLEHEWGDMGDNHFITRFIIHDPTNIENLDETERYLLNEKNMN